MGNKYSMILRQIELKKLSNFNIALMAIMYWVVQSPGMSDAHLTDIMARLNYTFDLTSKIFNDSNNYYTILQMLTYAVDNIYPTSVLPPVALSCNINVCLDKGYITQTEADTLINSLATVVQE